MISVVARAQNGKVVDDVEFDWDTDGSRDAITLDPSDDTMSAMVTAEDTGDTKITVTAVDHAVAGEINIEVTPKAGNVKFYVVEDDERADEEFEPKDSYFPGDPIAMKLEAFPNVKHRPGSDIKWTGTGAVKVEVLKENNDYMRYAKITAGGSAGTGTVTAEYENGKKASFNVVVSGPREDWTITYGLSATEFEIDLGDDTVAWDPVTITIEVTLENADGRGIEGRTINATINGGTSTTAAANQKPTVESATATTNASGVATITINDPDDDTATGDGALVKADGGTYVVTLSTIRAKDVEVKIVTTVIEDD